MNFTYIYNDRSINEKQDDWRFSRMFVVKLSFLPRDMVTSGFVTLCFVEMTSFLFGVIVIVAFSGFFRLVETGWTCFEREDITLTFFDAENVDGDDFLYAHIYTHKYTHKHT
jgi:hypothetical protein